MQTKGICTLARPDPQPGVGALATVRECFKEAIETDSEASSRARDTYQFFDGMFKGPLSQCSTIGMLENDFAAARELLSLFLIVAQEKEDLKPPAQKTGAGGSKDPKDKEPEDDDQGDDSWKSSWGSQDWSQGSGSWWSGSGQKRGSASGWQWGGSEKRRGTSSVSAAMQRSHCMLPLALALGPFVMILGGLCNLPIASAMEMVAYHPAPAATVSVFGALGTLAWWFAGTSVLTSIPPVVEVATQGVEEVVYEVVQGSKLVVRCVSIGLVVIAAISIVKVGFWLQGRGQKRRLVLVWTRI